MSKRVDYSGRRFGRLLALRPGGLDRWGRVIWECRCDCGAVARVRQNDLHTGRTRSCGCCQGGALAHGHARRAGRSRTYRTWRAMIGRCEVPSTAKFHNYGGRGIRVCARWRRSFAAFLADMGERPPGKTLDRINGNKNYTPSNCRWATPIEQNLNRRK